MTPVTAPMMTTSTNARCMNANCIGSVNQSTTCMSGVLPSHVLVLVAVVSGKARVLPALGLRRAGRAEDDNGAIKVIRQVVRGHEDDFAVRALVIDDLQDDLLG